MNMFKNLNVRYVIIGVVLALLVSVLIGCTARANAVSPGHGTHAVFVLKKAKHQKVKNNRKVCHTKACYIGQLQNPPFPSGPR